MTPLPIFGVGAALAIAWDWNWFKAPLEARLSLAAGRRVSLDGRLGVDLGRVTPAQLHGLAVANDERFSGDHPARAETIGLAVELLPLLRGRLVLERVRARYRTSRSLAAS